MRTRLFQMSGWFSILRPLLWSLLFCALLAPRVSVAVATLSGLQSGTVIICTGTGLLRVSVSAEGEILEQNAESEISAPCVLPDSRGQDLQRAWQRMAYPEFAACAHDLALPVVTSRDLRLIAGLNSRAPPAGTRV